MLIHTDIGIIFLDILNRLIPDTQVLNLIQWKYMTIINSMTFVMLGYLW
jgi:hypothetical protein